MAIRRRNSWIACVRNQQRNAPLPPKFRIFDPWTDSARQARLELLRKRRPGANPRSNLPSIPRSREPEGQHREFHRDEFSSHRRHRATSHQRPRCERGFLRSHGDDGGCARRFLPPGRCLPPRRRRHHQCVPDGRRAAHTFVSVPIVRRGRPVSRVGDESTQMLSFHCRSAHLARPFAGSEDEFQREHYHTDFRIHDRRCFRPEHGNHFCTEAICEYIIAHTPIKPVRWYVEGNMSGDKKATAVSFSSVRGKKVTAEVVIARDHLERTLRTSPEAMMGLLEDVDR